MDVEEQHIDARLGNYPLELGAGRAVNGVHGHSGAGVAAGPAAAAARLAGAAEAVLGAERGDKVDAGRGVQCVHDVRARGIREHACRARV